MARLDEVLRRKGQSICPQCKGQETIDVPVVNTIQEGYRTVRYANIEKVKCGKCKGKGSI
jgi:hypothetical protein